MAATTTIAQVRSGLKTRIETISGMGGRAHATWPTQINPPAAIIAPQDGDYHTSMGSPGHQEMRFEVLLLVQKGTLKGAQDRLDEYVDPSGSRSLKAAIEGDTTLGGVASAAIVTRWRDYGDLDVGGMPYGGVVFEVTVWP